MRQIWNGIVSGNRSRSSEPENWKKEREAMLANIDKALVRTGHTATPDAAKEALLSLNHYSLIQFGDGIPVFYVHTFLTTYIRNSLRNEFFRSSLARACYWLLYFYDSDDENLRNDKQLMVPHAICAAHYAKEQKMFDSSGRLWARLGDYFARSGAYSTAAECFENALSLFDSDFSRNRVPAFLETSEVQNRKSAHLLKMTFGQEKLIDALLHTNNHESFVQARRYAHDALRIRDQHKATLPVPYVKTLVHLAETERLLGNHAEGEKYIMRAIQFASDEKFPDKTVLPALLSTLQLFEGYSFNKEAILRFALECSERYGDRFGRARDLLNLGAFLVSTNRCEEAKPLLSQSLEILNELKGPISTEVAKVLTTRGIALLFTDCVNDAAKDFKLSLSIHMELKANSLEPDVLDEAIRQDARHLVLLEALHGRIEAAEAIACNFGLDREWESDRVRGFLETILDLAQDIASKQQIDMALSLYRIVRPEAIKRLGAQHELVALIDSHCGFLCLWQKQYVEAITQLRSSTDRFARLYGELDDRTIDDNQWLARALLANGDHAEAKQLLDQILKMTQQLGAMHPQTAKSYEGLADYHLETGNIDLAIEYRKKAMTVNINILDDDNFQRLAHMLAFAEFCVEHHKCNEANGVLNDAFLFAETSANMEPIHRIHALCWIAELQSRAIHVGHRPDSWHKPFQAALEILQQEDLAPPRCLVDLAKRYLNVRSALIGLWGTTGSLSEPNYSIDIDFVESIVEYWHSSEDSE